MVNVNTQVTSSMELPFGEYTSSVFYQLGSVVSVKRKKKAGVWQLFSLSSSLRWCVRQPLGSRALLDPS